MSGVSTTLLLPITDTGWVKMDPRISRKKKKDPYPRTCHSVFSAVVVTTFRELETDP